MIVDGFNASLRAAVSALARLFEPLHPLAGLAVISVAIGVAMLWVVGKTSNQAAIARAKKRMQAHLLEMRLYNDEPGLLLRAQGHLLANNARYLGHMLRPALVLALPMVVLYAHFDAVYGRRPLRVGESALVSAYTEFTGEALALTAPEGFVVESVSVTTASTDEVVWRIRATGEGVADLGLETPDGVVWKSAVSGSGTQYVSASRSRSWWERLLLAPGESGYDSAAVRSLEIHYPTREVGIGGWNTHWVIWFLGISILSAFFLKGLFGIVL